MSAAQYQEASLKHSLRQMLALLEHERQAFAALDLDKISGCAENKARICDSLAANPPDRLCEESRGMLEAVKRLNEANRKLRNLVADNVHTRLATIAGASHAYLPATGGNVRPVRANPPA